MDAPSLALSSRPIVIVHFSDIHFSRPSAGPLGYTADDDIRHELRGDVGRVLEQASLGPAHFVFATGDVAFGGQRDEYARADAWLREICERVGCPEESVRTIPGNHDVQRKVVEESQSLQDVHAKLRGEQSHLVDGRIANYLADNAAPDLLFAPLQHYNHFAAKFGCAVDRLHPFWTQDVFLNDGSTLRLRGLNSALISDKHDDRQTNKLVVGARMCLLKKEEGVEHLVMCHHPPSWLHDEDEVDSNLSNRARVLLFGHKHVQRVLRQETNAGHMSLRLHAGAVNPEPNALEYQPRYNVLALSVVNEGGGRRLRVEVHRRVWDMAAMQFAGAADAGGGTCQRYDLPLDAWSPAVTLTDAVLPAALAAHEPLQSPSDPLKIRADDPASARMNAARRLAYRFLALPYHQRMHVAQQLALLRDEDQDVADPELSRRFFQRAKERDQMADFWRVVEHEHGAPTGEQNPFQNV